MASQAEDKVSEQRRAQNREGQRRFGERQRHRAEQERGLGQDVIVRQTEQPSASSVTARTRNTDMGRSSNVSADTQIIPALASQDQTAQHLKVLGSLLDTSPVSQISPQQQPGMRQEFKPGVNSGWHLRQGLRQIPARCNQQCYKRGSHGSLECPPNQDRSSFDEIFDEVSFNNMASEHGMIMTLKSLRHEEKCSGLFDRRPCDNPHQQRDVQGPHDRKQAQAPPLKTDLSSSNHCPSALKGAFSRQTFTDAMKQSVSKLFKIYEVGVIMDQLQPDANFLRAIELMERRIAAGFDEPLQPRPLGMRVEDCDE
ncbi:hypothetical protein K431DRAFT_304336 [Polychaeton citri CBS 116435]|uniref:BZIP domain-containing protein n=1 Tax=Polychaeton citri CBS 116435 TaxID=1314669 RepID=A0A9P4Q4M9_9PEZI|nr:hypothetical protein K431DRAFT_304336 [Polychaeton citri CBS 116435]